MEAVHLRRGDERQGVDVLEVRLVVSVWRRLVQAARGEGVVFVQNLGGVKQLEYGVGGDPVVAVGDLPAVVALAARVHQRLVRHLGVLVEEHLQLPDGDAKVVLVEVVRDVEPDGAVFPPLLHRRVKKREAKAHLAPGRVLGARVEELAVGQRVGHERSHQAGAEALRCLVGHLD